MKPALTLLTVLLLAPLTVLHAVDSPQEANVALHAQQWAVFETSFTSARKYDNPFVEVEVDVVFKQGGKEWKIPAFWAGDKKWTIRFAPPTQGKYTYRVECSDKANSGLNGKEQALSVAAYTGDNLLLKHGPLRVTKDQRHFEHADGTPFLWLGDTWWKGLCKRMTWEGFQELTADRKKKGFNVVQIVCGTYPDERGSNTDTDRNTTRASPAGSVGSGLRRIGAKIRIARSPFLTARPNPIHVRNPATRVAWGAWAAIRRVLLRL